MTETSRVAVVTGGARGLGRAISLRLAEDGIDVSVWDLDETGALETAAMVSDTGVRSIACGVDCSSATAIASAVQRTREALGPAGILVNNAALSPFCSFEELTEEAWDSLMAVNLKGPFLCCQAMIPEMREAGWGRIINIASSSAQTGARNMAHYGASKGGVLGLTKCLALEYATTGITVNAVPPNFIDTEGLQNAGIDIEAFARTTPLQRTGKPRNIAAAVAFLASEDADYITGHTLGVNGGRYCN